MPRVYLPLLPIPLLAAVVAFSACARRGDEAPTHVIPPAVALAPAEAAPPPPAPPRAASDEAPTPEEVAAFESPVAK